MLRHVMHYINNGDDSQGTETICLLARVSLACVQALSAEYDALAPNKMW